MRDKLIRYGPLVIALILAVLCACVFMIYINPMENVSYDLSLMSQEDRLIADPEQFDNKGWTVYTQEGDVRTELTPDGYGGYTGLELGQTFYLSRVLVEELDSPTLSIDPVEWRFSVWLEDDLIYTDCPELDNRIGYLQLPVNEWYRDELITIILPSDYQGKTLTIAQSFPDWAETSRVMAYPASVRLYCGYASESSLISETFRTALMATLDLLLMLILLLVFVRHRDWSTLCLAVLAFLWMVQRLMGASFYYNYFHTESNSLDCLPQLLSTLALLCFLTIRGGTHKKWLWVSVGGYGLSVVGCLVIYSVIPYFSSPHSAGTILAEHMPYWLAGISLAALLVMGTIRWRKENWFYRVFMPLAFAGIAISWALTIIQWKGMVWQQIVMNLSSGQVLYLFSNTISGIVPATLITAVVESVKTELDLRAEQRLMEQRKELTMASYENLRRQHEEVMIMRHDMLRHFHTLHSMGGDEKRTAYLEELIGQNQKIRPVVESGNEMMDIILNGKLGAAVDAGIRVEIPHVTVPEDLPLSDPDLCSLIMNIVDNAITAASTAAKPYILLKIHERDGFLGIVCENSFEPQEPETEAKKETVPEHGLGLKIVRGIVAKCSGVITEKIDSNRFIVKIVIPL